jgi:Secretion system C-terminal sorting domain
MKKRILLFLFLVAGFSSLLFSQSILSIDKYWDDGGNPDNEWPNANNWDNNALPANNDDGFINNNFSANIATGNNIIIESVNLGADSTYTGTEPIDTTTTMILRTSGELTIDSGATLTTTKGGPEGSDGFHIEGIIGNESLLTVNGTLIIESNAKGDGLDINEYTSVVVGSTGVLDVTAYKKSGIKLGDDLTNSGAITVTGSSPCKEGIKFSGPIAGSKVTNNSSASITIIGNGFIDFGIELNSDFTFENYGTVTISGTTDNILEGGMTFNNYGTFAGDGVINASTFNCPGSSAKVSPGTTSTPIGKITFDNNIDISAIDLDIDINGATSYDTIEARGTIDITGANLNLSGSYVPVSGDEFLIIEKVSSGPITGTFNGIPDGGTILFNGVNLYIFYFGGDGNDVYASFDNELPLPVELIDFKGYAEERSNILRWQTASEKNSMVFIVERSLNGATDFEEIDRVDAFGNSTIMRSYESEDSNPLVLAYYHLRIVDFDGTFEFSDVIAIERSNPEIDLVEVFPVPAEEEVTVLIQSQSDSKVIITLSDFLGRKILEEKIELNSGINRYTLNWKKHDTNFYYLSIYNGKERIVKKILHASRN